MTGIQCYYVGEEVQAIVRDGKAVYMDGQWAPGWAERTIRVGVSEYLATNNRKSGSMFNPLVLWGNTSRVTDLGITDVEGAFKVLDEESIANNWELTIDKTPYYVSGSFHGKMWQESDETTAAPTDAPTNAPSTNTPGSDVPTETTEREPFPEDPGGPPAWFWILIISGAVVLAAGIAVLVVVLVKRKKKTEIPEHTVDDP